MSATRTRTDVSQTSRPLAPEDVRPGQYVFVFHTLEEAPPFWARCGDDHSLVAQRMILPAAAETVPFRVVEVCVPFVLVAEPDGAHRTLDLRRHRLARVSDRFGQRAFARLRRQARQEESDSASSPKETPDEQG